MSLTISVNPGDICWLVRLSRLGEGIYAKVVEQQAADGVWRNQLFRIPAHTRAEEVENFLKREPTLHDVKTIRSRDGFIFGTAMVRCSRVCGIEEAGPCILRSVSTASNGEIIWNFIGTGPAFRRFMQRLTDRGIMYKTLELSVVKSNGGLTSRQELILKAALELGFFEYPKKIHVKELAQLFGITPASLTETLRKALKKIVREYMSLVGGPEIPDEMRYATIP
jgi:predicted DNA binding protein